MFFDEKENTFSFLVHISKKKKEGGWRYGKASSTTEIFPSGRLKYSVLLPLSFPFEECSPPPALKLSTCKRYVGIRREINIWSLALEKQLERS